MAATDGVSERRLPPTGIRITWTLLAFLVLPSVLFALLGRIWFIDRAWINLDYLVLGAACIWLGNRTTGLAVFLLICADLLFAFAPGYHLSIASVLGSASELFSLDPLYVIGQAAIALAAAGLCTWAMSAMWVRARGATVVSMTCIVAALLVLVADARLSGQRIEVLAAAPVVPNIGAWNANHLRIALAGWRGGSGDQQYRPMAGASSGLRSTLGNGGPTSRHVVLVVVESLGAFVDPELNALQMQAFEELAGDPRFTVQSSGQVGFEGSTVPGELRELCGIRMLTVHPRPESLPVGDCLPALMRDAGYATLAAHGFMGTFFSRNLWYPALGFDAIWFASDFSDRLPAPRRCGIAFHGICDASAWQALVDYLQRRRDQRNFVYWLTISTHLPVPAPGDGIDVAICQAHPATRTDPDACHLLAWHHGLFSRIVDSLQAGLPDDTTLILVGDHAPPFLDAGTRGLFDPARVPYVVIAPARR